MVDEIMIAKDFTQAHEEVIRLVETFSASFDKYHEASYNETAVRNDFLNKFFIALGWDVNHETQTNPYAQEVKVERSVKVAARVKKADYAFFIEPNFHTERFFVEAKRPSATLETPDNCFQTIRYAYSSSRAALSLLTNFKEFIVMDCQYEPDIKTAVKQVHKKFYFEDFKDAEKFAEIFYLFGREAVANSELDRYAETKLTNKGKGKLRKRSADGYREIDESFLEKLEEYRAELAKMFKRKNPALNSEDLTEATQRTLDRLVFIRFLEDKLIEPSTILDKFGEKPHAWKQFVAKSKEFDKSYNGIIFKSHPVIDADGFAVDDDVFLNICNDFASAYSPYHFNYVPIHILGSIYERFLGNVIVVKGKNAEVEPKPEVRKAGGVFYTPEYIVRYIVENTIGKLVEKKTPKDVAAMRFADIACGSGSFLLGVYDYLLRWHTQYYNQPKNKAEAKRAGCAAHEDGTFHLSFEQKREILTNNIYGTDIDRQAFEVTQLSLFLKLLEEETQGTKQQYLTGVRETMLPTLSNNIQCGNALVDWDVTGGDLFEQLDYEKERRLNPMSFKQKFPEVMKKGGFDAIVGNPPYVRQELISDLKGYLQKKYDVYHGVADLYVYFFERYISLLKVKGVFGIIVANKWMRANYGEPLRRWLKMHDILEIIDFGDLQVFQNATTYPCIVRVRSEKANETFNAVNVETLKFDERGLQGYVAENSFTVNQITLDNGGWNLTDKVQQNLLTKLRKIGVPLSKYVNSEVYRGIITGLNEAFVINEETKARLIAEDARSAELIKPFLAGREIKRYQKPKNENFLILMPKGWTRKQIQGKNSEIKLIQPLTVIMPPLLTEKTAWKWLNKNYSAIADYLEPFTEAAKNRYDKGEFWWELRACDYYDKFQVTKIIYPNISKQPEFTFDDENTFTNQKCFIISKNDKYLLALLNSSITFFLYKSVLPKLRGDFYEPSYVYFKDFPIRLINFNNQKEKAMHDALVRSVEQLMQAKAKLAEAKNDGEREHLQNKCDALESSIDDTVFDLYDLSREERDLIRNA
ncbi:MAG: TaqI-like C-terminal specificity domain-containing protein [Pyrinomonadaceae bacterium]